MINQSMPWFRMYTDFLNDPKMIGLAFEDQRHFIGILALKSDGALDQDCCPDLLDRIVAQRLWIDHAVIREVKKRLIAAGLIDDDWQPIAWDKRQMRSDVDPTNAERQRRYRQRKKQEQGAAKAEGNAPQDPDSKEDDDEGDDSNALRNARITQLDTDTDTDKETEERTTSFDSSKRNKRSESFDRFWLTYPNTPRRVAKAKCSDVWKTKKLHLVADDIIEHVKAMRATKQWRDGYEPAPLTYLNQRRWEDGLPGPEAVVGAPSTLNRQEALEAQNRNVAESWAARMQSGAV